MSANPARSGHLLRGSVALVLAVAINGLGGFSFWWLVAGHFDADAVGAGQELFVAITVAVSLTSMGLPIAVARFCTDASDQAEGTFRWSVVYSAATSVIGAGLLVALVPATTLAPLDSLGAPLSLVVLAVLVTGMSLAVLVEVRLMALRRWGWVLVRVGLVVGLRLPLLWWVPAPASRWFVLLAAGAPALSGLVGAAVLMRGSTPLLGAWQVSRHTLRAWFHFATVNYAGLLGTQAPMFVVPFIVALRVDDTGFASFYIAWAVTQMVFVVPHMLGQTYLVEAGRPDAEPDHQFRVLLALAGGFAAAAALASAGIGRAIGWSLGPEYHEVATLLPWLVAGCAPWAITSSLLARARHQHDSRFVVLVTAVFCVASLGCVVGFSASGGASGAASGWLVANVLVAGLAVVAARPLRAASHERVLVARPLELEGTLI